MSVWRPSPGSGTRPDQARFPQRRNHGAHGLRAHGFGSRQMRDRGRPAGFEPKYGGDLGWGQIVAASVHAQAALELTAYGADFGGQEPGRIGSLSIRHQNIIAHIQVNC